MRESSEHLDPFRVVDTGLPWEGVWHIPYGDTGPVLTVIASTGLMWDHVSVSMPHRTPTWHMMCFVKKLFFEDAECVMQLHPPTDRYINNHEHCLHLWRPQIAEIPMPLEVQV